MILRKSKTLFVIAMALVMLFSTGAVGAYATTAEPPSNGIEPMMVVMVTMSFKATSSSVGAFSVKATSDSYPSSMTVKVTLQSAPLGSTSFSNVSGVSPQSKTEYNVTTTGLSGTFPITSSKEYRIKVEASDVVNGLKTTTVYYQGLTR